jgi:hypothetical protein
MLEDEANYITHNSFRRVLTRYWLDLYSLSKIAHYLFTYKRGGIDRATGNQFSFTGGSSGSPCFHEDYLHIRGFMY